MKRLLLFAAGLLMLSSCGFTRNRQGENSIEPQAEELLKEILGSIAESMQTTDAKSVSEEPVEEEISEEEPARELKWYEKDYSITVVDLDEKVTYTYTRKGKKMTIEGRGGGKTQKEDMDIFWTTVLYRVKCTITASISEPIPWKGRPKTSSSST